MNYGEYVLAFILYASPSAQGKVEIQSEYKFNSYSECERFANNKSRDIILKKYTGTGITILPACKQIDRATAMRINADGGI